MHANLMDGMGSAPPENLHICVPLCGFNMSFIAMQYPHPLMSSPPPRLRDNGASPGGIVTK